MAAQKDDEPDPLTVRQTAVLVRVPLMAVYTRLYDGRLIGCKADGKWSVDRDSAEQWIKERSRRHAMRA